MPSLDPQPPSDGFLARRWRRLGLAPKVILSLTIIVALVSTVSAYIALRNQEALLLREMIRGVDQLSQTIRSATWQAMRLDQRQSAYEVMQTVGRQEGIEKIRIFNKEGRIMFSTGDDLGALVDKSAEACDLCHSREQPLVRVDVPTRSRLFTDKFGRRVLGMVTPIYNEPACSGGDCHAHPAAIHVLGVLDVSVDLTPVDEQVAMLRSITATRAMIEIGLLGLMILFLTRRLVGQPIRRLILASRSIGGPGLAANGEPAADAGAPREQARPVGAQNELAQLQSAFEEMRERLDTARNQVTAFTRDLERKVEQRTAQLESTRVQLVRAERLASLGRLAASVAHEINNPVSGVLNLSRLMQRLIDDKGLDPARVPEVRAYLTQVIEETTRVGRIVSDLLAFARQSRPRIEPADLADVARRTLSLLSLKLRHRDVDAALLVDADLPLVSCDRGQVEQVLINLVMNAAEAGPDGALLEVRLKHGAADPFVSIEVEDRGSGIPAEHLPRIFDPFFTTKEDGKGVGLGLAVAYGIIEAHGGTIDVVSQEGRGTTFRVRLPLEARGPSESSGGGGA
jgi:two-component system NtrC family sensor kinase